MRPFLRTLRVDLRRSILSAPFFLSLGLLLLVQFAAVFAELTSKANLAFTDWPYYLNYANTTSAQEYAIMLVPCLVYAWSYCQDRDSGFYGQAVQRVGFRTYTLSRIVSVIFSALLAGILSVFLFTLFLLSLNHLDTALPSNYENRIVYLHLIHLGKPFLYVCVRALHNGLVCAMAASVGLAVSAFIPNTHVAVFSPLILYFIFNTIGKVTKSLWFNPAKLLFSQYHQNVWHNLFLVFMVTVDIMVISGYLFYRQAERRR